MQKLKTTHEKTNEKLDGLRNGLIEFLTTFTDSDVNYVGSKVFVGLDRWEVMLTEDEGAVVATLLVVGERNGLTKKFAIDDPFAMCDAIRWLRYHLRDLWVVC